VARSIKGEVGRHQLALRGSYFDGIPVDIDISENGRRRNAVLEYLYAMRHGNASLKMAANK
jgi:hypothetical protein